MTMMSSIPTVILFLRKNLDSILSKTSLSKRQTQSKMKEFVLVQVGPVIQWSLEDKFWTAGLSTCLRVQRGIREFDLIY